MNSGRRIPGLTALLLLGIAVPVSASEEDCAKASDAATLQQAEQKLVLLRRLVGETAPVQRVLESNNVEAERALAGARSSAAQASDALDAGCTGDAIRLATNGLSLATQAFALARNKGPGESEKYEQLLARTQSFLETLEAQPEEARGVGAADLAGMQRQIDRARELAVKSDYESAAGLLAPVADRLERRIVAIYNQKTVYYEKSFDSPADEYAYLSRQYVGYQLLFERFGGEKQPPHSAVQRYRDLLDSAAGLASDADGHAQASDWDNAIASIEGAIQNCEAAMRLLGIGY